MLRTRLWMGAVLVTLTVGVLVVDQWLAPWYPFLFLLVLALTLLACYELLHLLTGPGRPVSWFCYLSVTALLLANWAPNLVASRSAAADPWPCIVFVFMGGVLAAFVLEMALFRGPGTSVQRIALTVWLIAYLGLMPSFLVQLRWLGDSQQRGVAFLALAIFVPKCCDSGAYLAGRLLGRHSMTPTLSPKKTWEGFAGGMVIAVTAAVGINRLVGPVLHDFMAVGFGAVIGLAATLGDLAESLIKRDCGAKDASQVMPGFGGVLDVVDSIMFSAPAAYWWLR